MSKANGALGEQFPYSIEVLAIRKVFAPDRASSPKQTRSLRGLEYHILLTLGRNREEEGAPL